MPGKGPVQATDRGEIICRYATTENHAHSSAPRSENEGERSVRCVPWTIPQPAGMAGRIHGQSSRGESGFAVVGIPVEAGAVASLRICGGLRAHRQTGAASAAMEGPAEIIRDLFSARDGISRSDQAGGRGGRDVRLLATGSETSRGPGIVALQSVSAVEIFSGVKLFRPAAATRNEPAERHRRDQAQWRR